MIRNASIRSRSRGLTLIELMISLVLGLLVVFAVSQLFLSSRQAFRTNDALGRMQESGRVAMEYLTRDIRMAGYAGCARGVDIPVNVIANDPPAVGLNTGNAILGYDEGAYAGSLAGTDAVVVSGALSCGAKLTGNMTAINANIQVSEAQDCGWNANQILMVTDCESMDIFRAGAVSNASSKITIPHPNSVNTGVNLSKAYQANATVMSFSSQAYFVADLDGDGVRSLYRNELSGGAGSQPITDGVEGLELRFGIDTNSDGLPDAYQDASVIAATDWTDVVSVDISILLCDPAGSLVATTAQTYRFPAWANADTTAPDRRARTVMNSTVSLRNRTP